MAQAFTIKGLFTCFMLLTFVSSITSQASKALCTSNASLCKNFATGDCQIDTAANTCVCDSVAGNVCTCTTGYALNTGTGATQNTCVVDPKPCGSTASCSNFATGDCLVTATACTCADSKNSPCSCQNGFIISTAAATLDTCIATQQPSSGSGGGSGSGSPGARNTNTVPVACTSNAACANFAKGKCDVTGNNCVCNGKCSCKANFTISTVTGPTQDTCVAFGKPCTTATATKDCSGDEYKGTCTKSRCDCAAGYTKKDEKCNNAPAFAGSLLMLVLTTVVSRFL